MPGHILVDFDGTLAHTVHGVIKRSGYIDSPGLPIEPMVKRVKVWLSEGRDVRIFTARVSKNNQRNQNYDLEEQITTIETWCVKHLGQKLPITCSKDFETVEIWDDRAIGVIKNTGLTNTEVNVS